MYLKARITSIAILISIGLSAQDFDGDSIYYTPIPKPLAHAKKSKAINSVRAKDTVLLKNRPNYFFAFQLGSMIGCSSCNTGTQLTSSFSFLNGVSVGKKVHAGMGLGLDAYDGWVTLPMFGSISYDLFGNKNRNALYLQFQMGGAKAWNQLIFQSNLKRAEGGVMLSPQLGYRIKYHNLKLAFAIGTKHQTIVSYFEYPYWNWVEGQMRESTNYTTIKQTLNRFMFSMSVGIN